MGSGRYTRLCLFFLILLGIWWKLPPRYSRLNYLACQDLPGADDVVLIMRTGVTEIEERLPASLDTTLRCPRHSVIFSDHEEMFQGKYHVRDVLANLSPDILQSNPEFGLYHRVKEVGREGLSPEELTGVRTTDATTDNDKVLVPGWVVDKWKFIPMMNETWHLYPNKKWYVFVESDTYFFWSTLLKYVSTLDHTQPQALGHRTTRLSDHYFMQGGSGWILSHEALRLVVDHIKAHHRSLDLWMEDEWAGDISLGTILGDVGVPMTYGWPIFQPAFFGVTFYGVVFGETHRYWCYPAGTYHHMTPESIRDIWRMEQQWIKEEDDVSNPYKFISQADVFNNIMMPRMRFPQNDWDNLSDINRTEATTLEACKQACVDDGECKQFQFDSASSMCKIAFVPIYGEADLGSGMYSEWFFDRIEKWRNDEKPCVKESFLHYGDIELLE